MTLSLSTNKARQRIGDGGTWSLYLSVENFWMLFRHEFSDVNISALLNSFQMGYDKRVRPNYGGEFESRPRLTGMVITKIQTHCQRRAVNNLFF